MYSRKNKREVVFAKRRISTAYSLVAVVGCQKRWSNLDNQISENSSLTKKTDL